MTTLELNNLSRSFGGVVAVQDVSFNLGEGELLGLIGPNGAGKSTVLGMLGGAVKPEHGSILLHDIEIAGRTPHEISELGLRRCYQIPRTLQRLSVLENMLLGARVRDHCTLAATLVRPRSTRSKDREITIEALAFLEKFDLMRLAEEPASALSGGQRKLLSIGQALMGHPAILILDEPVAGIHPSFVNDIAALLLEVRANGVSILVVEHNLRFLELIADRVVVMANGMVLAEGPLADIRARDDVANAYLGQRAEQHGAQKLKEVSPVKSITEE